MNPQRFDHLTRLIAGQLSRRRVVQALGVALFGLSREVSSAEAQGGCPAGLTDCFGRCVDLSSDTYHCGACGRDCTGIPNPGYSSIGQCVDGQCQPVCLPDADICGDQCTDFSIDPWHCGGCDVRCAGAGESLCCGGRCVSEFSAERFCDFCGQPGGWPQGCAPGEICDRGVCIPSSEMQAQEKIGRRLWRATAQCEPGEVMVEIENRTGRRIYVGVARARSAALSSVADYAIENGEMAHLRLAFDASRAGSENGALVVTSAGAMALACGQTESYDVGVRPVTEERRQLEWPAIAAQTIGRLESWRDFDALYALLHPDAQALVSEDQVRCWYTDFLRGQEARGVTILDVQFVRWSWSVTGKTYDSAEITYRQAFQPRYGQGPANVVDSVEHLVLNRGQWRWFLGFELDWLTSLPSTCLPD